jgi:putative peptidoglycan lipid II flippase
MLRRLTAEGTMAAAFLPSVNETEAQEGENAARELVARFLGTLGTILFVLSLLGIALMSVLTGFMLLGRLVPGAPLLQQLEALAHVLLGVQSTPPILKLTTLLSRIMFPYLLLVSLTAGLSAVLNLRGRFGLPASVSALMNLVFICFAKLTLAVGPSRWRAESNTAVILAVAVMVGGLAQLFALWPAFRSLGYWLHFGFHFRHPGVVKALRRMVPGILGTGIHPINAFASAILASQLAEGSQMVLYNSNMMGEMVLGLFAVSLATVSLPTLSRLAEEGDRNGFRVALISALRGSAFLTLPAAVGMAILAKPIVAFIFQTGRFQDQAVSWTAGTLTFQCAGLLFIAISRITAQALYALKDYRGPALAGMLGVLLNILLSFVLMGPLGTRGMALANGVASLAGLVFLIVRLQTRIYVPIIPLLKAWILMFAGVLPMGYFAWWGAGWLGLWTFRGTASTAIRLFPLVASCGVAYWGITRILKLNEAVSLQRRFLSYKNKSWS